MAITEKYASSAGSGDKNGTTEGHAWDFATMLTAAAAGDRVNFKGNHSLGSAATFSNTGSTTAPIIVRGYSSSIGDLSARGRTNGNGALVTTNVPVFDCGAYSITQPAWGVFQDLSFTGSRNGSVVTGGQYAVMIDCTVNHTDTDASATALATSTGTYSLFYDSDFILSGGSGGIAAINGGAASCTFAACRIDGGSAPGAIITTGNIVVACTIFGSASDAIVINNTSNNCVIAYNTLVGNGSDGIHLITGPTRTSHIFGNLIVDNTAYGVYSVDAAAGIVAVGNRLDRNGGATDGAADWLAALAGLNNTTAATQGNEFPGYGSDDFRLGATSPARQSGTPRYFDIGALQRIEDYPAAASVLDSDTVDGAAGTIATRTLSTANDTVSAGYYAATTLSAVDTDLAAANIVSGTTIFGVEGSASGGGSGGVFVTKQQGIGV